MTKILGILLVIFEKKYKYVRNMFLATTSSDHTYCLYKYAYMLHRQTRTSNRYCIWSDAEKNLLKMFCFCIEG